MHPVDAASRGIKDGDAVRVTNSHGEGIITARLSTKIMPGVVSLPEGIWVSLDEKGVDRNGSANMFTSTEGTRPAIANIMHGMNVEVTLFS